MSDLFRQLLGLRSFDWTDPSVHFGFERPLPLWAWITVAWIAIALAVWSYSRLTGRAWARFSLAAVRGLILILLAVLVAGPQLVQRNQTVERDWVLVLADRSASMTIEDAPAANGRTTREQQLQDLVRANRAMWDELGRERTLVWLGFAGGTFDLSTGAPAPLAPGVTTPRAASFIDLGAPDGRRTTLGAALDQALARAVARPLSAVVLLTDGRTSDEPTRAALRRLQTDLVPIHSIALGSTDPVGDIAIRRTDAPRLAFVGDITPVRVDLETLGGASGIAAATVRLIDTATGQMLDEQRVEFAPPSAATPSERGSVSSPSAPSDEPASPAPPRTQTVTLTHRADAAGAASWAVEVIPEGDDLVAGNNRSALNLELVDRPMRVLFVDGYPRWEQRYLRSLLIRERSITAANLMLAPDRRFTQEGDIELDALPDSPERWTDFDAVILGDVSPDVFTYEQLAQLRDHVATRGAGLIWIAGPGFTPAAWFETPLADLLPFTKDAADGTTISEGMLVRPTPASSRLGVMMLGPPEQPWPAELADPQTGWSMLRWTQLIDRAGLKPTAEVLADAVPPLDDDRATPLVIAMRFGAGRSLYLATDEIWRWRYGRGETLYERWWMQLIRMLGRESLARGGASALLEAEPRRAVVDQPVRVVVELLDQSLADQGVPSISVELERRPLPGERAPDGPPPAPIELTLRSDPGNARSYAAVWLPPEPGLWTVRATESIVAPFKLAREVEVALPDDELRAPETDHPLLQRLADQTGGKVFTPAQARQLPEHLPNRQVRIVNEIAESLWDTPLALILLVFLLTLEWVGRRVVQLM